MYERLDTLHGYFFVLIVDPKSEVSGWMTDAPSVADDALSENIGHRLPVYSRYFGSGYAELIAPHAILECWRRERFSNIKPPKATILPPTFNGSQQVLEHLTNLSDWQDSPLRWITAGSP